MSMELTIKEETYNPVLERNEIIFEAQVEKTLSRADVRKKLAALKNVNEANIVIKYIKQNFGQQTCYGKAHIYKSLDVLKRLEPKYLLERGTKKEAKKEEQTEAKNSEK
jgi:small subunit ribosomal protein S24e